MNYIRNEGQNQSLAYGIDYHSRRIVIARNFPITGLSRLEGPDSRYVYRADPEKWEQRKEAIRQKIDKNGLHVIEPLVVVDFLSPEYKFEVHMVMRSMKF